MRKSAGGRSVVGDIKDGRGTETMIPAFHACLVALILRSGVPLVESQCVIISLRQTLTHTPTHTFQTYMPSYQDQSSLGTEDR